VVIHARELPSRRRRRQRKCPRHEGVRRCY